LQDWLGYSPQRVGELLDAKIVASSST
jgi:hypothetical protein